MTSVSAPMMIEQAHQAYETLIDAELTYADSARHAVQTLTPEAIRDALGARARWRTSLGAAALATNRLGDSDVIPGDLPLGHAIVDSWNPTETPTPYPPGEDDLGATPDATLWIGRRGHLIEGHQGHTRITTSEFRARGGVLMRHQHRWVMVEEAIASRFPLGTWVRHTTTSTTAMVISPDGEAPWRASHYFDRGSVLTDHGWWVAQNIEPDAHQH